MINRTFKRVFSLFLLAIIFQLTAVVSADDQVDKLSGFIAKNSQKIVGNKKIGANFVIDWKENPEINEISSYSDDKRVATIEAVIGYLGENEKKIFPEIISSDHAIVYIAVRFVALNFLTSLVSSSNNDIVIKDYLDSEIADLQMMLNGTFDYGAMYLNARKMRDDKIVLLLSQNKGFITEKLTLMMNDINVARVLANKTSIISLMQTCASIPKSCLQL